MGTLYNECKMGIAGDMLTAALLEICPDRDRIVETLNNMGLEGVSFELQKSEKCGITGSYMSVLVKGEEEISHDHHDHDHHHDHHDHDHHHEHSHSHDDHDHGHHVHRGMKDIEAIISGLSVSDEVKRDAINVYKLIAEAESTVHGRDVSEIHFHEVGSMDAIADITAVCLLIRELAPDNIIASPVHVGSGQVHCAHGILPVPAPATALLLEGIPSYSGNVKGELCTPTGAALLKYFARSFGAQPVMSVEKIGYGMGKKDFPEANCVRAMLGDVYGSSHLTDTVVELVCNLDDMTAEEMGFATEKLMEDGALDVFTTSIAMKKNRPATMLTVLCKEQDKENIVKKIFKYTTTIGIRESVCRRYILDREESVLHTSVGDIRVKKVSGYGVSRQKAEYEDLLKVAKERGISIREVKDIMGDTL